MGTWEQLAPLEVQIDGYSFEAFEQALGPDFTRYTTVIHMQGGGEEGLGEDVVLSLIHI